MIVIDGIPIELRRTPDKTTLLIQGRPYAMELKIGSLDELQRLALFFANEVGLWSDDLIEQSESTATLTKGVQ